MKQSTTTLKNQLEAENIQQRIDSLKNTHGKTVNGEMSVSEAYDVYKNIRELLLESIEKGIYEEVPFARRNAILSVTQQVHQYAGNPTQFISSVGNLEDYVSISRLWERAAEDVDIRSQMKELTQLKRKLTIITNKIEDLDTLKVKSAAVLKEMKNKSTDQVKILDKVRENSDHMETLYEKIKISHTRSSENEQEIEDKKKNILAFNSNIEESKTQLSFLFKENKRIGDEIEAKMSKAKELIEEAKNALELKSTQAISRAYGERLKKLNDDNSKKYWLLGAGISIFFATVFGMLLTGFTIATAYGPIGLPEADNAAVILGRIAITGLFVTAAVFCAKRYLYIKNLEEDYEYKVVLTKSILAFAGKIGEIDPDRVAEYLNRVLLDLHQDPSRKTVDEKIIDDKVLTAFTKFSSNGQKKAKV